MAARIHSLCSSASFHSHAELQMMMQIARKSVGQALKSEASLEILRFFTNAPD